jgi:hypothetical protein
MGHLPLRAAGQFHKAAELIRGSGRLREEQGAAQATGAADHTLIAVVLCATILVLIHIAVMDTMGGPRK